MASPKSLYTITGGYGTSPSSYKKTRPDGFVPFHTNNANYVSSSFTTKNRSGGTDNWTADNLPGDVARFNASGIWHNGGYDSSRAYRHRCDNNKERRSVVICGWPYGQVFQDIERATSAPITQFAGIQFKWNTADSHWSDSAIRINSKDAVGLVCYDWDSGKTYVQRTSSMYYSGRSPITDGSNSATSNNGAAFILSSSDETWVRQNKIYLVGFYIQFFQKNEGGMTRYRYFNMWDLQIVYSTAGAGAGTGSYRYKMVMPGKQTNGIEYHGEPAGNSTRRPVKLHYT